MKKSSGFALIESLIAVLILALGIVGALGMQMRSLTASTEASMRTEATIAVDQLVGMMWNDLCNANNYAWGGAGSPPAALAEWYADLTTKHLPGAQVSIVVTRFGPTVTTPCGPINQSVQTDIVVSWIPRGTTETRRLAITSFSSVNPST